MTDQDRDTRSFREDATETRLQADPMLRPGRAPYAWPIAIALAVLAIAVVLFATNQDDSDVAETGTPAITTNEAPQDRAPPAPSTTGSSQ